MLSEYSLAKINPFADPNQACLLAGEVSAGWGAVMNNPAFRNGCSVAVWGLNNTGLAIIQAARYRGARCIYAIDSNH